MSALSSELQDAIVILITSLYASKSCDEITKAAADTICRELRQKITGSKPSDADFRQVTKLGGRIADDGWDEISGVGSNEILQKYK